MTVRMSDQYGRDAWLQLNGARVEWQDGEPVYLVIYIDITNETELRQMQTRLEEQAHMLRQALSEAEEANRAKSDFLSSMSHDIRTPMNAILGMASIAENHLDDRDRIEDCLRKISLSGQHLLGLINDVLDMSRIESGKMTLHKDTMSLLEVMDNVAAIMQPQFNEKNQRFSIHQHKVVHETFCSDSLRLRQVFINILSNACKFTPDEGSIDVDIREEEGDVQGTALFTFTFTDTGVGMEPEFLEHVFDAFSRERDSRVDQTEGTGLGMAISRKIVELLGGRVEVSSQRGEGTVFCVILPLVIEEAPVDHSKVPGVQPGDVDFSGKHFLLVEDNALNQEVAEELLADAGASIDIAGDGVQGVEAFVRSPIAYDDLILMDIQMPLMDGYTAARKIRSLPRPDAALIPILAMTADAFAEDMGMARDAGMNGHIAKPLDENILKREIKKYL